MFNGIIRFALQQRLLVIAAAVLLMGYGAWQAMHATSYTSSPAAAVGSIVVPASSPHATVNTSSAVMAMRLLATGASVRKVSRLPSAAGNSSPTGDGRPASGNALP